MAHRRAREYLEKHGVERWFRTAAEKLIVAQPENPFSVLYEALGREVVQEREEKSKGQGDCGGDVDGEDGIRRGVSLAAKISIRGRDGIQQVISLDKVANDDMARFARGAIMLRGWGSELGARVSEALVGRGSGVSADGESGGDARYSVADLEDLVAGLASDLEGLAADIKAAAGDGDGKGSKGAGDMSGGDGGDGDSGSNRSNVGRWELSEEMRVRLRELFGKIDKDGNGVLDSVEREEMREEMRVLPIEFGIGVDVFERLQSGVNYAEFEAWFVREWETASKMQALAGIDVDLLRAAAQSIPSGSPDFPLEGIAEMDPAYIARECREKIAAAAEEALIKKKDEVREQAKRMMARKEKGMEDQGMANSKYAILGEGIRMAKFGSIDDFHTGIAEEIGLPNPNLMEGMEAEHCARPDSKDEFNPGNYDTTTTPAQEWLVVTDEDEAKRVSAGLRKVRTLKELKKDPLVQKAELRDVELLALLLYTGLHFNLRARSWTFLGSMLIFERHCNGRFCPCLHQEVDRAGSGIPGP